MKVSGFKLSVTKLDGGSDGESHARLTANSTGGAGRRSATVYDKNAAQVQDTANSSTGNVHGTPSLRQRKATLRKVGTIAEAPQYQPPKPQQLQISKQRTSAALNQKSITLNKTDRQQAIQEISESNF